MLLLLLNDMLDMIFATLLIGSLNGSNRGALANIARDKRAHIMFGDQRLTTLYADFAFVQCNLHRLRLRITWGVDLLHAPVWHGHLHQASTVGG